MKSIESSVSRKIMAHISNEIYDLVTTNYNAWMDQRDEIFSEVSLSVVYSVRQNIKP